jgi:hypothetical protein
MNDGSMHTYSLLDIMDVCCRISVSNCISGLENSYDGALYATPQCFKSSQMALIERCFIRNAIFFKSGNTCFQKVIRDLNPLRLTYSSAQLVIQS